MLWMRSSDGEIFEVDQEGVYGRLIAKVLYYTLYHGDLPAICIANTFESATTSTSGGELEDATTCNDVAAADGTINGKAAEENARSAAESDNTAAESSDDFLDSLADEEVLFEVMMVAHYLNIPGLEHLTCVRTGERMRGMTLEETRAVFNLASDFTPEEEAAIRRQDEWAFSRT
ncbi:hypothetical protein L7F22_016972 [Adiantum nelumboides]|nr:hypothetical protein [Adiantum nelumboides]